jgi:chemotaxis protein MotB
MRHLVPSSRIIPYPLVGLALVAGLSGCVTKETHTKTLAELDAAKAASAQQATELESLRQKSKAQTEQLQQQMASLQEGLGKEEARRKALEQEAADLAKDREALLARSQDLQSGLDGLEREKGQLNSELSSVRGQIGDLEEKYASGTASAQSEIAALQKRASELEAASVRIAKEKDALSQQQSQLASTLEQERQRLKAEEAEKARLAKEQSQLAAALEQERERLKAEEAEKARLEQERAAKEAEIAKLNRTQEELSRSLQDEIAKGNITIQQVRDQLTINMVDRVLFDSGQAQVKPAGMKVLKQVSDVLKNVSDKQIRIEGHTDNVPISAKLQDKFKTNWELSTTRATTVVRYLTDHGGVDRHALSAVGYADTKPIASNDNESGRTANRRIEIVLYPRDLSKIAGQSHAGNSSPKP